MAHLPGYVATADKIKAAGVDTIACLSVNDAFVMGAWGEAQNASEIVMVADGNCQFTDAMGLTLDGTGFGMGKRSQRYAMIVDNGVISHINIEDGPGVDASSAETMMALL
jgi:peroxiredoxin